MNAQNTNDNEVTRKFQEFRKKRLFHEDLARSYPGLSQEHLRDVLTQKIMLATFDFEHLATSGHATDKDYQDKIKIGLERFTENYLDLDTEDRERLCAYFEELMDIVGLESSGGHLNWFMYDFDPGATE